MAKKKKKSGEGMGEFFKVNGEKIAFGAISLIALMLILFSIIGSPYTDNFSIEKSSPKKLADSAKSASSGIENTEYEVRIVAAVKSRVENKLDLIKDAFRIKPFAPILREEEAKRGEPLFFPVQSVEVTPGRGPFSMKAAPGDLGTPGVDPSVPLTPPEDSVIRGQYYVIVKGLIPYEDQVNAYGISFRDAIKPPTDDDSGQIPAYRMKPVYRFYNIQRAEMKPGETADQLDWVTFDARKDVGPKERDQRKSWAAKYTDIVHTNLLVPGVVPLVNSELYLGLPPLVQRNWTDKEVCHSSLLELNRKSADQESGDVQPEEPKDNAKDEFGSADNPSATGVQAVNFQVEQSIASPKYRLFRYIDYNVQPGKRYVYRVQLLFLNPNEGLASRYIAKSEFGQGVNRQAPWSEPSPVAEIGADEAVLVGAITPLDRKPKAYDEPHVAVDCLQWVGSAGYFISKNFSRIVGRKPRLKTLFAQRGDLLNTTPPTSFINPMDGIRATNTTIGVATNNILVDFRGGKNPYDKNPPAIIPPVRILISNSAGKLEIHYPDVDNTQRPKYGLAPAAGGGLGDESLTDPTKPSKPGEPPKKSIFD